ncbi:MAG: arginyltransferase [Phycisphaerae bacterium]|nr:arginyltransferase [Phycisphaerae bacterium]MDW8263599.1 arginyltransferase [Phycisphaerales bacterium]
MFVPILQSAAAPNHLQEFSHYPTIPPPRKVPLTVLPAQPCAYLPDRFATVRAFVSGRIDPELYHDFMDAGFRRAGRVIYQNLCNGCRECTQLRVPVRDFVPSRSQRRILRKNRDLLVSWAEPKLTPEKHDLYRRYLAERHDGQQDATLEGLRTFLYVSPVDTLEFEYRDRHGRLLAVGICDVCLRSLSSVYFYFDPAESRRGLGNFGVLQEIEFARNCGIDFYYLGFWVPGSERMNYKTSYGPYELLGTDGVWRSGRGADERSAG